MGLKTPGKSTKKSKFYLWIPLISFYLKCDRNWVEIRNRDRQLVFVSFGYIENFTYSSFSKRRVKFTESLFRLVMVIAFFFESSDST